MTTKKLTIETILTQTSGSGSEKHGYDILESVSYQIEGKYISCFVFDKTGNNQRQGFLFDGDNDTWVIQESPFFLDEDGEAPLDLSEENYMENLDAIYIGTTTLVVNNDYGTFVQGAAFRDKIFIKGWNPRVSNFMIYSKNFNL